MIQLTSTKRQAMCV